MPAWRTPARSRFSDMEWRFVWSRGDEHETGRALSREMLRLYRDKAREKRDVPPDIGTVFIGNNGKPMTNGCYFNISHSHGLVACAVAEVPVGIDVEKIRPVPPRLLRILSPAERESVRCDADFFRLWTLKEALIKCRGGVLGQIRHVHFDLSGSSIICSVPGYSFSLLPAPEGYAAALCWENIEEATESEKQK